MRTPPIRRCFGAIALAVALGALSNGAARAAAPSAAQDGAASASTAAAAAHGRAQAGIAPLALVPEFPRATAGAFPFGAQDLGPWKKHVPDVAAVTIRSSADQTDQHALFYDPHRDEPRPLLVVLHSWSENYLQNIQIPYGVFAERNGWILIAPDHRGPYRTPEATASPLAQQDVLDAIAYAKEHARVDDSRVYVVGYSGSAMTALVLAGRHPELFAGVVSFVPVYDLVKWYAYLEKSKPELHYAHDVEASCGGRPVGDSAAAKECEERSPSTWLANARGRVHVLVASGIWDQLVPPDNALRAFNDLAAPEDRLSEADMDEIVKTQRIPEDLQGTSPSELFARAGVKGLFTRTSEGATVVVFQGSHDLVYNAGLAWLADKRRE